MIRVFLWAMVLVLLISATAAADSFRCPNSNIVSTGDMIGEVLAKCDPPAYVTRRYDQRGSRFGYRTIEVEEWTYNPGSFSFMYFLTFENGVLVRVRGGDYGN